MENEATYRAVHGSPKTEAASDLSVSAGSAFDQWWRENRIEMGGIGIMESAFKEISKKAWDAAILSQNV